MKKQKSIANLKAKNLGGFTRAFGAKVYGRYNAYTIEEVVIPGPKKPHATLGLSGETRETYSLDSSGNSY